VEHSGFKPEERKWFTDFLTSGFVDSFRERHPGEGGHYTWWSPRAGAPHTSPHHSLPPSSACVRACVCVFWIESLRSHPTHSGARGDNRGWRLDYILVDDQFYRSDVVDVRPCARVASCDVCVCSSIPDERALARWES
jgi:hypothetical protein